MAAKDVAGVSGLAIRNTDIKSIVKDRSVSPVRVTSVDGAMTITIFICIKDGVRIPDVCDAVQKGIKNSVQSMTGRPVAKVNVIVDDIEFSKESEEKE